MTTAVLIEILLKSSLVAGVALVLVMRLKSLPAAKRAWIAHLGLLLALLMPVLVLFSPDLELTGPWSQSIVLPAETAVSAAVAPLGQPALLSASADAAFRPTLGLIALAGWGLGAGVLLLGLLTGLARLLRLQRDAAVLTDRDWLGALAQAQHRMGVKQGTALLRSERVSSPISWGLLRPTILLSPAALRTPEKAEAILAHELAHVVRMDWANLMIARLATAVFWFNPLVWLLAWQAHELREEAADDVVLRGDVRGTDYASLLVGFARDEQRLDVRTGALAAHGVAPGKQSLRRRLVRVLDGHVRRDPARPLWVAACAGAAVLIAAPLAAFTPIDRVTASPSAASPSTSNADVAAGPSAATPTARADAALAAGDVDLDVAADADVQVAVAVADPSPDRPAPADGRLSPEMLGQMRMHGVTPQWIAAMEREFPGMRRLSAEQMVALALHRVTPDWIRSMRAAGYGDLTYEQMSSLAVHRVTPAYIRDLESAGYRNLPVDQLVALRIFGVDSAYIRDMEADGVSSDPRSAIRREQRRDRRREPPAIPQPPAPPAPPPYA